MPAKDISHSTEGGSMTEATYLDDHYLGFQAEYEAMLALVKIQPGMTVLDAGCGGGAYLSSIAKQVGEGGRIAALDIAADNVKVVQNRIASGEFPCEIGVRQGSVVTLPYPDDQFDVVWSANVIQYLTDEDVKATFAELMRVTKPGGLVGIKNTDFYSQNFGPFPMEALWRNMAANIDHFYHQLRQVRFPPIFRKLGFVDIENRTVLGQRLQPLRPVEHRFLKSWYSYMAAVFLGFELEAADRIAWQKVFEVDDPDHMLNSPDFHCCLSDNVTVAKVAD